MMVKIIGCCDHFPPVSQKKSRVSSTFFGAPQPHFHFLLFFSLILRFFFFQFFPKRKTTSAKSAIFLALKQKVVFSALVR